MGVSPPLPEPISLVFPSPQPQNGLPLTAPGGLPSACRPLNLRRDLSVTRPPHGERRSGWNPSLPARDPGSLVAVCCGYPPGPPPPIPARPLPPQPRASSTYTRSLMLLPLHAHHPCRHRQRRPPHPQGRSPHSGRGRDPRPSQQRVPGASTDLHFEHGVAYLHPIPFLQEHLPLNLHSVEDLSLIHISEPTRLRRISYAVFCLTKKKTTIEITFAVAP